MIEPSDKSSDDDDEPLISLVKKKSSKKQTRRKTKTPSPKKRNTTPKKSRETIVSGENMVTDRKMHFLTVTVKLWQILLLPEERI